MTTRPGARARGERRRRAILDAALVLLGRGGSGAVTHRAVAAEAGVPLAATTYYFASKDELLREAFALAADEDVAALRAAPRPAEATVATVARHLTALMTERLRGDRATLLVQYELELEAARRPELTSMSRAWTRAYVDEIAPVLDALGSAEPKQDAWVVATSLTGMELELLGSGEADPERALLPKVERLLGALLTPPFTPPSTSA